MRITAISNSHYPQPVSAAKWSLWKKENMKGRVFRKDIEKGN